MATVQFPDYQLEANWNSAGGLTAIETILAGYETLEAHRPSAFPRSFGTYDPGVFQIRGNGLSTTAGFALCTWPFDVMGYAQARGLMDNFAAGGYTGLVTLRTRTDDEGTYANFNATMRLPKPSELRTNGYAWLDYTIRFSLREAL